MNSEMPYIDHRKLIPLVAFVLTMSLLFTPRSEAGAPEVDSSGDEFYTTDDDTRSISSDPVNGGRPGWRTAIGPTLPRSPLAGGSRRGTHQTSGPAPKAPSLDSLCVVGRPRRWVILGANTL